MHGVLESGQPGYRRGSRARRFDKLEQSEYHQVSPFRYSSSATGTPAARCRQRQNIVREAT
jgi:hypothetical protein